MLIVLILFTLFENLKLLKLLNLLLQSFWDGIHSRVARADIERYRLDTWRNWAIVRATVDWHEVCHYWVVKVVGVVRGWVKLGDWALVMGVLALSCDSWGSTTWMLNIELFIYIEILPLFWRGWSFWLSMRPLWIWLNYTNSCRSFVTLILTFTLFKLIVNLLNLLDSIHLLFFFFDIIRWWNMVRSTRELVGALVLFLGGTIVCGYFLFVCVLLLGAFLVTVGA